MALENFPNWIREGIRRDRFIFPLGFPQKSFYWRKPRKKMAAGRKLLQVKIQIIAVKTQAVEGSSKMFWKGNCSRRIISGNYGICYNVRNLFMVSYTILNNILI